MKILTIVFMILSLISCDESNINKPTFNYIPTDNRLTYDVIELDGCQYICGLSGGLTHKGNCKNTIHQHSH